LGNRLLIDPHTVYLLFSSETVVASRCYTYTQAHTCMYAVTAGLGISSLTETRQEGPFREMGSPDKQQSQRQTLLLLLGDPHEDQTAHLINACGDPRYHHVHSLVGGSVSGRPQGSRLVNSEGLPVESLSSSGPLVLPPMLPQDSLSSI